MSQQASTTSPCAVVRRVAPFSVSHVSGAASIYCSAAGPVWWLVGPQQIGMVWEAGLRLAALPIAC